MRLSLRMSAAVIALGCAAPVLAQEADGLDWSVGLRGSYVHSSLSGARQSLSLTPEASLALAGESSATRWDGGGEIVLDSDGTGRIADVNAGVSSTLRLGATTVLDGAARARISRAEPDSGDLPPDTLSAPLIFDGRVEGSVAQDMGRLALRLGLDGARILNGPTILTDLSNIDNAHDNYWLGAATLRLGYALTPRLSAFVEGEISAQSFDAPSPALMKYLDGRTYALRGGLGYSHDPLIAAEIAIGRAWLDYVDPTLTDAPSWTYDASITLSPGDGLSVTGSLATTIGPSDDAPGDTDVVYVLASEGSFAINEQLGLRASAGWSRTTTLGSGEVRTGYDFGGGVDYRSSRHVTWSADYLFAHDRPATAPAEDTHKVTVGVRVSR